MTVSNRPDQFRLRAFCDLEKNEIQSCNSRDGGGGGGAKDDLRIAPAFTGDRIGAVQCKLISLTSLNDIVANRET